MGERKARRPVTAEHPCIAAAVAVLRGAGGRALTVSEIFEAATEKGLLPASSVNTIRGRLSQHVLTEHPALLPLPKRKGYVLAAIVEPVRHRRSKHLRDQVVTSRGRHSRGMPPALRVFIDATGGEVPLRTALLAAPDRGSLEWLVDAFPFDAMLRDRLLNAKAGARGRACVLAAHEARAHGRVVTVRAVRAARGAGKRRVAG